MDRFYLRRAVERLRSGLFDSVAVTQLTVEEHRIENVFSKRLQAIGKGQENHLCLCGSYGQGKSHTLTYLNQLALSQGYATSSVQLDLREVPFHQFAVVYRSIMERLVLPGKKNFISTWKEEGRKVSLEFLDTMPHRLRVILTAMLSKNKRSTPQDKGMQKDQAYRPKEHGYWLDQALMGHDLPVALLKRICKDRGVEGYQKKPLNCRGSDPYFQMVQSLGALLKEMGYHGLLLFFDEAESIGQGPLGRRAKGYHLLNQFFQNKGFVFPLFAFTEDFFDKVRGEPYEEKGEIFPKNYAEAWRDLNIFHLQGLSSYGWESLLDRLMELYSEAYQIALPKNIKLNLESLLDKFEAQEIRFQLKALVNLLDITTQHALLDP